MADSTYTTGRNVLIKWLQNLNAPNSSEQAASKSLDVDIADVVLIMRALGMQLVSFEKSGEVLKTGSRVVIGSKRSGVKYVMEKTTTHCNCPTNNSESSFWSVSGIGSKEKLTEADSSAFPKISSGLNQILHNTLIDILHVMREVELKPNKKRNYIISTQKDVPSPRSSLNTSGIRHAVSMPAIRVTSATPKSCKEIYPLSAAFSKIVYPAKISGSSNEAVVTKFEYIQGEIDLLLSNLKLKQLAPIKHSEINSVTSQFSEINLPKECDSGENPEINSTEVFVKKLEHIKEEMEILQSQLKNILKQPPVTSRALQNDFECVGNKGIIKKKPSPCSDRLSMMQRSAIPTRTPLSVKKSAMPGAVGANIKGSEGAIKKKTSICSDRLSTIPRMTMATRTPLPSVKKPAKQEAVGAKRKDSVGGSKVAIKTPPVYRSKFS